MKVPVSVLGATGLVGQRYIQLLENHPWFEVVELTGSERSVGRRYGDACRWMIETPLPEKVANKVVLASLPKKLNSSIAFSALPSNVAKRVEPMFAEYGVAVFSNSSAFRREPDVPLLLPEVNPDHIDLVEKQKQRWKEKGFIVTSPNCTSTGITLALKAIHKSYQVTDVFLVSMQALTGAGYPGVPSLAIFNNIIPNIPGEERKIEWEPRKILGTLTQRRVKMSEIRLSAHSNRVPLVEGHFVCMSIKIKSAASVSDIQRSLQEFRPLPDVTSLPSSPLAPIRIIMEESRPQHSLDLSFSNGMVTLVGGVRDDPIFDFKMNILSHNTIRGAAGGSIYNGELAKIRGYV